MSESGPRIAYLCSDPGIGPDGTKGASVHFREMAEALRQAGASTDVLMARRGSTAIDGVRIVTPRKSKGLTREVQILANNAALLEALAASGPHDGVYERLSLFGLAGLTYARQHQLPFVVEINAPLWAEASRFRSLELSATAKAMAIDVMRGATQVYAVSRALADQVIGLGVPAGQVEVLANGVRGSLFDRATPAPRPSALTDKPTLLFVGSLKPWHGVEFLLEAFAALRQQREVGLWVVGEGPLRALVEAAAAQDPDIHYHGGADHETIPAILKAADLSLAPYLADAPAYFCPLKIVESLAAGCPVLASRVPCVESVVADHADCSPTPTRLFVAGDCADFVRAAGELLDSVPAAAARAAGPVPTELRWSAKARLVLTNLASHRAGTTDPA